MTNGEIGHSSQSGHDWHDHVSRAMLGTVRESRLRDTRNLSMFLQHEINFFVDHMIWVLYLRYHEQFAFINFSYLCFPFCTASPIFLRVTHWRFGRPGRQLFWLSSHPRSCIKWVSAKICEKFFENWFSRKLILLSHIFTFKIILIICLIIFLIVKEDSEAKKNRMRR